MKKKADRKNKLRRTVTVLLAVLIAAEAAVLGVWWGNNSLKADTFAFAAPGLPDSFDGFRIVQLSDLHGKQFGKGNADLVAAVAEQSPDAIFVTGDLVDAHSSVEDIVPLIEGLVPLAPVYYVTGNHEWGSGQARDTVRTLRELGVTCLENEFVRVERGEEHILVAGVHDPNGRADQKTPEQLAAEIYASEDTPPFWLLLAHRNNLFNGKYCRLGAALTFCGHAHGGIWRLPFTDGLIDTQMRLFPSFTSGFYQCTDEGSPPKSSEAISVGRGGRTERSRYPANSRMARSGVSSDDGAWVFVSRGLGNSPRFTFRLFNRPQVAVITLRKG